MQYMSMENTLIPLNEIPVEFWNIFNTHVPFGTSPQNCSDINFHFLLIRFRGRCCLTCSFVKSIEQVLVGAHSWNSTNLL